MIKALKRREIVPSLPSKRTEVNHHTLCNGCIENPNKHTPLLGQKEHYWLAQECIFEELVTSVLGPLMLSSQSPVGERDCNIKSYKVNSTSSSHTDPQNIP